MINKIGAVNTVPIVNVVNQSSLNTPALVWQMRHEQTRELLFQFPCDVPVPYYILLW